MHTGREAWWRWECYTAPGVLHLAGRATQRWECYTAPGCLVGSAHGAEILA